MRRSNFFWLGLMFLVLAASVFAGSALGSTTIPINTTVSLLLSPFRGGGEGTLHAIIWNIRLPRVILAALVGASLSLAGGAFQGLLRNPLADPFTLGVSSGAALGASVAIFLIRRAGLFSTSILPLFAFIGALLALAFVYNLARIGGRLPVVTLLLAGVVVSSFLSAAISLLMIVAGEGMSGIFFWLAGGFSMRGWEEVRLILPFLLAGSAVLIYLARDLNIILTGEEQALYLGINVERVKVVVLAVASLITGAAVSVSGMIGFVGLIVPHAVRMVFGPDHRWLLPLSCLLGASLLIWTDMAARVILAPQELPVGVITAFIGAPFFIYLLRQKRDEMRF